MSDQVGLGQLRQNIGGNAFTQATSSTGGAKGTALVEEASVQSLVQDALEELTFSAAEQAKSVDVESVEVEDLSSVIAERIKKRLKLKERLDENELARNPKAQAKLLAQLKQKPNASADDILKELGREYSDPSDLFLALEGMREELTRERGNRQLKKAAKQASDTLWEEYRTAIVAGLNAQPIAKRFSRGNVEQFQVLREAYREQIEKEPTLGERLQQLRKKFGDNELDDRLKYLIAATGRDIESPVTSLDPERLNKILQDLFKLQLLSGTSGKTRDILARMKKRFGLRNSQSEWDLLENMLGIVSDKWIAISKFDDLSTNFVGKDIETRIYFLREINLLAHQLPVKLYNDLESRARVIELSQDALDQAIRIEEDL